MNIEQHWTHIYEFLYLGSSIKIYVSHLLLDLADGNCAEIIIENYKTVIQKVLAIYCLFCFSILLLYMLFIKFFYFCNFVSKKQSIFRKLSHAQNEMCGEN